MLHSTIGKENTGNNNNSIIIRCQAFMTKYLPVTALHITMTISGLVRIEVCPTVLVVNSVFVAVGVGLLFVDRSVVDRSREVLGCVVSSVVGEVVRPGLCENQNCQGHNKELRM